jgi:hypothetical protein
MFVFKGILYLLWRLITLPVHILFALIKLFIITPLMLLLGLVVLGVACVALAFPTLLPSIGLPRVDVGQWLGGLTSTTSSAPTTSLSPASYTLPSAVTCEVRAQAVMVAWNATSNPGTQWYQVLRRSLQDAAWHRIGLVTAASSNSGHYEYADQPPQHGATYRYAVIAVAADGAESSAVESVTQVVAP